MNLVTLAEAHDHLRRDTTDDDADLELKIAAASHVVLRYLRSHGTPYLQATDTAGNLLFDSNGDAIPAAGLLIEPMVKSATLLVIGELYKNREGETTPGAGGGYGYLPPGAMMLLSQLRDPVIA